MVFDNGIQQSAQQTSDSSPPQSRYIQNAAGLQTCTQHRIDNTVSSFPNGLTAGSSHWLCRLVRSSPDPSTGPIPLIDQWPKSIHKNPSLSSLPDLLYTGPRRPLQWPKSMPVCPVWQSVHHSLRLWSQLVKTRSSGALAMRPGKNKKQPQLQALIIDPPYEVTNNSCLACEQRGDRRTNLRPWCNTPKVTYNE